MNVDSLTDEELVELVRIKDQEFYRGLVERYEVKLTRYASYILKNQEEASDVVQDAFIKAFKNLNGFDTKKKFSSWIYRIVHNEAMNSISKRKKLISFEGNEDWLEYIEDDSVLAQEEVFDKNQIVKGVKESLAQLPIQYRICLAFFYLEEKSYEEISDILRIPMGTVGIRINRGKKMLKKVYERKGKKIC